MILRRGVGANADDQFSATGLLGTLNEGSSLVYDGTTVGTVVTNSGGLLHVQLNAAATQADVDGVIQSIAYSNSSLAPPADVTIDWSIEDSNGGAQGSGGNLLATGSTTVDITAINDRPTLTSFVGPVSSTVEDTTVEITFAELATQGNQADVDGSVTAFVVKGVPSGTLRIGTSAATATAFVAGTNDVVDATRQAYWTPSLDSNGTINAFTVVALDDGGLESIGPVALQVVVTAVNDAPVNSVPTTLTLVEETRTPISGLSIQDVDAGAGAVTTRLQVVNGVLDVTLSGTAVISAGANGSTDLSISGTIAEVNATLGTLQYTPNTNITGVAADTLTVTTDDGGNFGGPPQQDVDTVQIDITNVNDEEIVTTNIGLTINEGVTGVAITRAVLETTDPDNTPNQLVYTLTSIADPATGTLRRSGTALSLGQTFTQADINAGLVTYDHTGAELFTDGFTFTVDDGTGTRTSGNFAITINPVNDHNPIITSDGAGAGVSLNVDENSIAVTTVTATDADLPAQTLSFALVGGADQARFGIDSASGVLTFAAAPDFEAVGDANGDNTYEVVVEVRDGLGRTDQQTLQVTVTDVDEFDVTTIVDNDTGVNLVSENVSVGTDVGITAFSQDLDGTTNAVTYSLDDDAGGLFTIDSNTGVVTTSAAIDFESTGGSLNIVARATSADGSTATQSFAVTVTDVDEFDITPIVDTDPAAHQIAENVTVGTAVGVTIFSQDLDGTTNAISYSLDDDAGGLFTIDSNTGVVTTNAAIDFETTGGSLNIVARATSADGSTTTAAFVVTVNDVNEFDITSITDADAAANQIDENVTVGTAVGITAFSQDPDGTMNGVTYSLDSNAGGLFAIDSVTGVVTTNAAIDFETVGNSLNIVVRATSADGSTTTRDFAITVNDVNDNPPEIVAGQAFAISETAPLGASVRFVSATDTDSIGTLAGWTIISGNSDGIFAIDAVTGEITIVDDTRLNHEQTPNYTLTLSVSDGVFVSAPQTVAITVINENEAPTVSSASFSVSENAASGTVVGTVLASDEDIGDTLTYAITGPAGQPFTIDSSSGVLTVTDAAQLDFEVNTTFAIDVSVTDSSNLTTTESITITINNQNESPLDLMLAGGRIAENSAVGSFVATVTGTDPDVGDVLTFALLDSAGGRFAIDAVTGQITVANTNLLDFEAATLHQITVRTTDVGGLTHDASFTVTVVDVNEAPVAADDQFSATQMIELAVPTGLVTSNDFDVDGDTITVILVDAPLNGTVQLNADGSFTYQSLGNFSGRDRFTYRVSDGLLTSNLATVEITVLIPMSNPQGDPSEETPSTPPPPPAPLEPEESEPPATTEPPGETDSSGTEEPSTGETAAAPRIPTSDDEQELGGIFPLRTSEGLVRQTGNSDFLVTIFLDAVPEGESREDGRRQIRIHDARATDAVPADRVFLFSRIVSANPLVTDSTFEQPSAEFLQQRDEGVFQELLMEKIVVGSTAAVSTSVSVGYVVWMLRGGSLLTTFLSSLPAWQTFDPLPVLESFDNDEDEEGESLAAIVKAGADSQFRQD